MKNYLYTNYTTKQYTNNKYTTIRKTNTLLYNYTSIQGVK